MQVRRDGEVSTTPRPGSPTAAEVDLQSRLESLVAEVEAPGAVFAVRRGSAAELYAAGTANLETRQPMTPETLFPVASVAKVYTATLAMQLVDDKLLGLDRPVRDVLPGFGVADRQTTRELTPRHLLTHSSGLDGDKFDGFGRGDDAIERYVADCADLGQVHELGATFSYCNSGMIILGRIIEVLRGMTFEDALQHYVLEPLGATQSGMMPEDLIWRPLAAGHHLDDTGKLSVFHHWENDRAQGPAGGVVTNATELLAFVQAHLDHGVAPSGARLLSEEAAAAMLVPQVAVPNPHEEMTDWGLGWELTRRPDQPLLVSHGGDLLSHHARMVACPQHDLSMCLLMNGDGADRISRALFSGLLAEVGARIHEPPSPPEHAPHVDLSRVTGTYQTPAVRVRLEADGDRLAGTFTIVSEKIAAMLPPDHLEQRRELVPVTDALYLMRPEEETEPWEPVVFYEAGGNQYLHAGLRAVRRTS